MYRVVDRLGAIGTYQKDAVHVTFAPRLPRAEHATNRLDLVRARSDRVAERERLEVLEAVERREEVQPLVVRLAAAVRAGAKDGTDQPSEAAKMAIMVRCESYARDASDCARW